MQPLDITHDVLVIGAGLSGLVAAHRLHAQGASVRVLEARERVGGRALTVPLGAGRVDLGGQWLSPTQDRLAALARELSVTTRPQERAGETLLVRADRRARTWLSRVPGAHALELARRLRALDAMSRTVPGDAPQRAEMARAWSQQSLGDWISANVRTDQARESLQLLNALHLGVEIEEVSLLSFLHIMGATSGLTGSELDGSEVSFVGGAQLLCERLARILRDRIQLGQRVTRIDRRDDAIEIVCGARRERGRYAILALSPALIAGLDAQPPWPAERRNFQSAPRTMAPVIKCALAYSEPFWRSASLSGEAYHSHGLVRAVVAHSEPAQPALMAFVIGDAARSISGLPNDERQRRVVDAVAELFGPSARAPLAYVDKDWSADELSGGCVAVAGVGAPDAHWAALRKPIGRVHFAGTETAVRWPNYLDGAVEAGQRAADEVLGALRENQSGA